MSTTHRTIVIKGMAKGHHEEGVLDTVATPGMHVTQAADGKFDISPETALELAKKAVWIVKEDQLQGKMITDAYAIGDLAFLYRPISGDHINLFVKAAENLVVGDEVVPEGGGTGLWIEKLGTEASYWGKALEASGAVPVGGAHVNCEWYGK